jgi:decaprenyl-phosphate phosphoribosyltransferase
LVNDIADAESDRRDPRKRDRPIAAGLVPQPVALTAAAILVAAGAAIGFPLGIRFEAALTLYACLAVSYSLWLKEVAVIDIGIVSSGFLIRAIAGGLAVHVPVSEWFLILISFGSLLIVAGKREADLAAALSHAEPGDGADIEAVPGVAPSLAARRGQAPLPRRPQEYSLAYLRFVWMMASAVSIAGYCLWAFSMPHLRADVPWAELSIIPFVLAILRYGLLLDAGVGGEPEEVILRDRPLQLLAVAWLVVYTLGVYLGR